MYNILILIINDVGSPHIKPCFSDPHQIEFPPKKYFMFYFFTHKPCNKPRIDKRSLG